VAKVIPFLNENQLLKLPIPDAIFTNSRYLA